MGVAALASTVWLHSKAANLKFGQVALQSMPVVPQEKEQELEQLTKELRQVNLQQFIQQTGTKVTVLPAEPGEEEEAGPGGKTPGA